MKRCRTQHSPVMQVNCADCNYQAFVPHSCGHRNCPHCQHHESQLWIERQVQRQVPADYFMITFRYKDSKTKRYKTKTIPGADFLWRIFQHILPKGFRRARNFGFLHPNSKGVIKLIHCLPKFDPTKILLTLKPRPQLRCQCCGAAMIVGRRRIPRVEMMSQPVPT